MVAVRNTGNIFVKGEGSVLIMDRNGQELASNPLKMGTVLAGDATSFQVRHPVHLADGDYLVNAILDYEGQAAILEGVEIKVRDGQPEVGCEPREEKEALPPASITEIGPSQAEDGGLPIGRYGRYAAYGAPLLVPALAALAFVLRRRSGRLRA